MDDDDPIAAFGAMFSDVLGPPAPAPAPVPAPALAPAPAHVARSRSAAVGLDAWRLTGRLPANATVEGSPADDDPPSATEGAAMP